MKRSFPKENKIKTSTIMVDDREVLILARSAQMKHSFPQENNIKTSTRMVDDREVLILARRPK